VVPSTLFTLADLFWRGDVKQFYMQWSQLQPLYGDQFWIAFWSENFFKAHAYHYAMHQHNQSLAQAIGARRLSFFFMKQGWRMVHAALLEELHGIVYEIDYLLKSGSISGSNLFEHLYTRWFTAASRVC
jgi:hypothetical protein